MPAYFMDARGKQRECRFLYHATQRDILVKKLLPGEHLLSKRTLIEHLGLSLSAIGSAYAALLDESYLEVKAWSGFFVSASTIPENDNVIPATTTDFQSADTVVASTPATFETENTVLYTSLGDLPASFSFTPFSHIIHDVLLHLPNGLLTRPGDQGIPHSRAAISAYLLRYHDMQAEPAQIVIGPGTKYLYGLIAQLLFHAALYGIGVQSYEKIRLVHSTYARPYELLPFDAYGTSADGLTSSRAALPHVTPYRSFPSSVTASAAERFEYLRWAKERIAFLAEDDYAPEFSFRKKPLETIYIMGSNDSVIYLNTFTKTLVPSMCIVYMVLPKHLSEGYHERPGFCTCTVLTFDQYMLAEYISRNYLERRLNQIRRKLRLAKQDSRAPLLEVSPQPPQNGSAN